jgi:general secretion pathway protein C
LLVSVALGALIAVEVAHASLSLLGGSASSRRMQGWHARTRSFASSRVDIHDVVAAHLFGIVAADPGAQDFAAAPATTANLVLAGTIATGDPRSGIAIILYDGQSKVYAVGDPVGGASLHSVYLDRVLLNRNGSLETLALPRSMLSVAQSIHEPAQTDSHSLADVMRVGASLDDGSGKLRGFRIYPGRKRTAFDGSGLRAGDLVTAVNGTALQDRGERNSRDAFDSIRELNSATLTIEREGRTQDITINLTPESTDAGSDPAPAPASG